MAENEKDSDAAIALGIRHYGETKNVVVEFEEELDDRLTHLVHLRRRAIADAFGESKRALDLRSKRTRRGAARFRVEKIIAKTVRTKKLRLQIGFRWQRSGADGAGAWIAMAFVRVRHPSLKKRGADLWLAMNAATAAYDDKGSWFSAFLIDPENFSLAHTLEVLDLRLREIIDLASRVGSRDTKR